MQAIYDAEAAAEAATEEEESDDDDDEEEEEDDDDDDDDESEEDETDPFDVAYLPGAQAPGTLVADKALIARFVGKVYGFSTTWARTGPDQRGSVEFPYPL